MNTEHWNCVTCWLYVSVSHTHSLGVDSLQGTEAKRRGGWETMTEGGTKMWKIEKCKPDEQIHHDHCYLFSTSTSNKNACMH